VTVAFDGRHRGQVVLDEPTLGLYSPPLAWASEFRYETMSLLMVLASDRCAPGDPLSSYDELAAAARSQ
jgi:UDP-2-acetamido-3-amino-2,3-dideoxy-glucuronate N-acetyltransferase